MYVQAHFSISAQEEATGLRLLQSVALLLAVDEGDIKVALQHDPAFHSLVCPV